MPCENLPNKSLNKVPTKGMTGRNHNKEEEEMSVNAVWKFCDELKPFISTRNISNQLLHVIKVRVLLFFVLFKKSNDHSTYASEVKKFL